MVVKRPQLKRVNVVKKHPVDVVSAYRAPQAVVTAVAAPMTAVRKRVASDDFFENAMTKIVSSLKMVANRVVGNQIALALVVAATVLAADYTVEGKEASLLMRLVNAMKEIDILKGIAMKIEANVQRSIGFLFFASAFTLVRGFERLIVVSVGLVSLIIMRDFVSMAAAALAVVSSIIVKDRDLRLIAAVLIAVYVYMYVSKVPTPVNVRHHHHQKTA